MNGDSSTTGVSQAADNTAEDADKLDKLAESSSQAVSRRLSASNVESLRKSSMSSGNDKGKNRMQDEGDNEDMDAQSGSEVESLYDSDDESLHCAICLSVIDDRTVVQPCCHDAYCFVCILAWTEQSRRCPLCVANIELLVHNIRSEKDYQKHYLPPLLKSDSPPPERSIRELREGARRQLFNRPTHPRFKYAEWKARNKPAPMPDVDAEDLALEKRRYVYKYGLYVKHVATNRFTRFRNYSAQQVSSTPELKQRLQKWLRRELSVFDGVDLAFLVDYCTNIASQLELRSDSATRLLAEFIGEDQAEHFWHETYSFLRSPYKDVRQYDRAVQYDRPPCKVDEAKQETSNSRSAARRKARSRSAPSLSESDSIDEGPSSRRESFRSRRDSWRPERPSPPAPSRREGDSYIPSYSRLNKSRPPPRKRADRRSSRDERAHRKDNGWHRSEHRETKSGHLDDPKVATLVQEIPKPPPKPEWDPEDEISLGESDVDSAPLITPKDDVLPPPKKASEPKTQAQALSIRGLAQTRPGDNGNGLEVDLIRDFGPDLLSRLSGSTNSTTRDAQSNGWPNARSMPPQATSSKGIQMKGRGFRKGLVSSEMHATLMARLSEEKSRSEATSPVLVGDIHRSKSAEKSEASLREHVLQVLKQRREQAAQTASTQSAKIGKAQDEVEATSGVLANSRASRTALLQSRLAAEKAAISPPILSPNDTRSQPAAETVKPSEPPPEDTATSAGDPAQRMAELRGRLAEQKAARIKA